jgi:hypothetical protein
MIDLPNVVRPFRVEAAGARGHFGLPRNLAPASCGSQSIEFANAALDGAATRRREPLDSTSFVHALDQGAHFQARDQGSGLIVMPDPFNAANGEQTTLLAARYRVPAMYYRREFAEAGGLIAYANDFAEQFPQAAAYVDRILKGTKPAGPRASASQVPTDHQS